MMKTISKGCYGVFKLITTNERLCKVCVARGTKTECVSYIIDLANDSHKLGWCSDVQLSLHVFPRNNDACFNVIKYVGCPGVMKCLTVMTCYQRRCRKRMPS